MSDYSEISDDIKRFVREELAAHEKREQDFIESILDAFPGRDVKGHHDYHDSKIKAAKAEEEFWHTAKTVVIQQGIAGLFAVLKWVAVLTFLGLAFKFGYGPVVAKIFGVTTP